ncbi:rod shape-determining protein MreD [Anoxynatronum sibiricum]|uniref:Rod shape-determining protein MreD n=1 Tax=Anoxynatronum sibiricum TaxID=210623 RepID=A0ABU9W119_9CLOT
MQKYVIALTVLLSIIAESALFPFLSIKGVVPNLTLILVISYALYEEEGNAGLIGLLAGLTKDIVVGRIIGVSAISFMLTGYFVAHYNRKIFAEHVTTPLILVMLATLFHESIYLLFVFLLGYQVDLLYAIHQVWMIQFLYQLIMTVPVYAFVRKLLQCHGMKKQY